jgi:signal transduction histidine kinase
MEEHYCWSAICIPCEISARNFSAEEIVMSSALSDPEVRPVASLAEALGRSLRHELGDFLQKVYASVAILETRIPQEWRTEREVLSRLRQRAEACRDLLDKIQDFLCPVTLNYESVDMTGLASELTEAARRRFPDLRLTAPANQPAPIRADPNRMAQVGESLLFNACEAARSRVTFTTAVDPLSGNVHWSITDDGAGIPAESMASLFRPFFSTRPGHLGLGLPLAQKLVLLHGGRINLTNQPDGGCCCQVWLPAGAANSPILPQGDTAT